MPELCHHPSVQALIALALSEDIGPGDVTSEFFIPASDQCAGRIFAKAPGVLAGVGIAREVFRQVDAGIKITTLLEDGAVLKKGDTILTLSGKSRSLLTGERTALNFLQRLSGVATLTSRYVRELAGTSCKLLDTRKTTPGWRMLEKAAVLAGGGTNHRMGLYDAVMVKDNHLLAEGNLRGLQTAIDRVHATHPGIKVELEADRISQVDAFLKLRGVDVILLDNMTLPEMRQCVEMGNGTVKFEASGGITLQNLRDVAATGVDFISCGAITHSATALDLSLDLDAS